MVMVKNFLYALLRFNQTYKYNTALLILTKPSKSWNNADRPRQGIALSWCTVTLASVVSPGVAMPAAEPSAAAALLDPTFKDPDPEVRAIRILLLLAMAVSASSSGTNLDQIWYSVLLYWTCTPYHKPPLHLFHCRPAHYLDGLLLWYPALGMALYTAAVPFVWQTKSFQKWIRHIQHRMTGTYLGLREVRILSGHSRLWTACLACSAASKVSKTT